MISIIIALIFFVLGGIKVLFFIQTFDYMYLQRAILSLVTMIAILKSERIVDRDLGCGSVVITVIHLMIPLLYMRTGLIINFEIGIFFVCLGILISTLAIIDLGRSFGILPSKRSVVSKGMYHVVRHPIYLGYILTMLGTLALYLSFYNMFLFGSFVVFTVLRVDREEQILDTNEDYSLYKKIVNKRLVPWVY